MISVLTTNACNLRCKYCFEHDKNGSNVSFATVKKFIDYVVDNTPKWNYGRPLVVGFLGGEPLLNLDVIEDTMRYVQVKKMLIYGRVEELQGGATTNIVAANSQAFRDFYKKYPGFELYGSLDGCPKSHDSSRRYHDGTGSSAEILKDWEWVRENVKSVNIVMTPTNVHFFKDSMVFLDLYFEKKVLILFENEGLGFDQAFLNTFRSQIEELKAWHVETNVQNALALGSTSFGPCTVCDDLELAIHPSGDITPCWTLGNLEDFSLGNINDPETLKVDGYRPCQVAEKYREKLKGFHGHRCLSRVVYGLSQLEKEGKELNADVFNALLDCLGDLASFLNGLGLNEMGQNYAKAIAEETATLTKNNSTALRVKGVINEK